MATKILRKLPPLDGVVPGETATLDLPIGPRYHKLILEATVKPAAGATAKLSNIMGLVKIEVNGKTQRQATAQEINDVINLPNGAEFGVEIENLDDPGEPPANGDKLRFRLPILFAENFRKSYAAGEVMAWPTRWPNGQVLGTFQVLIDVPVVDGATLHAITAYAVQDNLLGPVNAEGAAIFNLSKWWRSTITYTAAGERHLVTLPRRDLYQTMHFLTQTEDPITHIKIKRDGEELLDVSKRVNDRDLIHYGINSAALSANRLDVIFDRDDLPDSAVPMNGVREFEVIPTLASASATNKVITLLTQVYGPRD